jgi:hypothetical protein
MVMMWQPIHTVRSKYSDSILVWEYYIRLADRGLERVKLGTQTECIRHHRLKQYSALNAFFSQFSNC